MEALVADEKGGNLHVVTDRIIPQLAGPKDVLIKVHSAAINPVDWKMLDIGFFVGTWPHAFGCDGAGTIDMLGEEAKEMGFSIGDRVAAYPGLGKKDSGTLAQYYRVPDAGLLFKIPEGMSFEEASTLGVGAITAADMYYGPCKAGDAGPEVPALVYGASSSVGMYCVQIAKNDNRKVVAVASEKNHEMLKELGADHCLDYHSDTWEADAIKLLGEESKCIVLDPISSETTYAACARVAKACGSSVVAGTDPGDAKESDGVQLIGVFVGRLPDEVEYTQQVVKYVEKLNKMLEEGKLKGNPVEVSTGIASGAKAVKNLKEGKISGAKYVVRIDTV